MTDEDSVEVENIKIGKYDLTDRNRDIQNKIENKSKVIKSFNQIYNKLGVHSPYKFPEAIKNFYENAVTQT